MLTLFGCENDGVISLSPDETDLPRCKSETSTGAQIHVRVQDLETTSPVSCDPAGSMLVLPDGSTVEITQGNAGGRDYPGTYSFSQTNLGIYGLVVSTSIGDGKRHWWGTPEAIRLAKKAGYGAETHF